jgi:energy-converting hydrogenase A subunit M
VSAEDSLRRAEELLTKVEQARARLDESDDPDAALDVLAELAELAKQVEGEIQRARREAEADADARP